MSLRGYNQVEGVWLGVGAGLATCVVYPLLLAFETPSILTVVLAAAMGPLLGAACWGLREFLTLDQRRLTSDLAAASNALAGALVTAMFMVQAAAKWRTADPSNEIKDVWLGLDVAWDVYLGLGTLLFAISAWSHPRLGRLFAVSGGLIAVALLALNLAAFPRPPGDAGAIDVGPLVGLWYLAVVIAMFRSIGWARMQVQPAS